MFDLIGLVIFVFAIIWAVRIENSLIKLNETVTKIEQHLSSKKEKK